MYARVFIITLQLLCLRTSFVHDGLPFLSRYVETSCVEKKEEKSNSNASRLSDQGQGWETNSDRIKQENGGIQPAHHRGKRAYTFNLYSTSVKPKFIQIMVSIN